MDRMTAYRDASPEVVILFILFILLILSEQLPLPSLNL